MAECHYTYYRWFWIASDAAWGHDALEERSDRTISCRCCYPFQTSPPPLSAARVTPSYELHDAGTWSERGLGTKWLRHTAVHRAHRRCRCDCMMRLHDCSAFRTCAEGRLFIAVVWQTAYSHRYALHVQLQDVCLAVGMFVLSPVRRCVCWAFG